MTNGVWAGSSSYFSERLDYLPATTREIAVAILGSLVTDSNTRNIVSHYDLLQSIPDRLGVSIDACEKALEHLEQTKLIRRERSQDITFYTIVSEYLVTWIARKRDELEAEIERRRAEERAKQERVELADLLSTASPENIAEVKQSLGEERFAKLREQAPAARTQAADGSEPETVILVPGFLGTQLFAGSELIWMNPMRLVIGRISELALGPDGLHEESRGPEVRTGGLLPTHDELSAALAKNWEVKECPYDWRKDFRHTAAGLDRLVEERIGRDAPFHIVAHGEGGLVARAFLTLFPHRVSQMLGKGEPHQRGRLVLLGVPHHGAFAAYSC